MSGPTKNTVNTDLGPDLIKKYNMISERLAHGKHGPSYRGIRTLLFRVQSDLQMKTVGPLITVLDANKPFAYSDEIRQITDWPKKVSCSLNSDSYRARMILRSQVSMVTSSPSWPSTLSASSSK